MTTPKTALISGITGQNPMHSQRGRSSHKVRSYREAYGIYACNGILFNHESPRRGETFVTRKITRGLANISQGLEDCLFMCNIDALRDWGHAKDYVRMQRLMLQQDHAEDFVIATGVQYSVRQFINWTATALGMQLRWEGTGIDEVGYWLNPPRADANRRADFSPPWSTEVDPTQAKPPGSPGCQNRPPLLPPH